MNKLYTKKYFLQALQDAGLPFSYPTILRWEEQGIIEQPIHMQEMNGKKWRFYTRSEIKENVEKIRQFKSKK